MSDFPVADPSRVDPELEKGMDALIQAVQLGRACRNTASMKVRQPAAALYVKGAAFSDELTELARDELNVKRVLFVDDARAFTTYKLKPQMRTLGPRYGKALGAIGKALLEMDGNDVVDALARGEAVRFAVGDVAVELGEGDILTEPMQKPGFVAETENGVTVVLDTNLTEALLAEGFAREVISKVQTMRKEADFEVTDRIHISCLCGEKLAATVRSLRDMILAATLGLDLTDAAPPEGAYVKDWNVNGEEATLGIWR